MFHHKIGAQGVSTLEKLCPAGESLHWDVNHQKYRTLRWAEWNQCLAVEHSLNSAIFWL